MNLNQRSLWGFHTTMGCVYLGVIGSDLVEWYEARDAILLSGLALCGFGLLTCGAHWGTGRRRVLRHEPPGAMCGPSSST